MKLFGREILAKPKKGGNQGKPLTAQQKAERRSERFLRNLQKTNPEAYEELMIERTKKDFGVKSITPKDNLAITMQTLKQLKDMGMVDDPKNLGDNWIRDVAKGLGEGAAVVLKERYLPSAPEGAPPIDPNTYQEPRYLPPAQQPETQPQVKERPVSIISNFAIGQLQSKEPEQAALWIRSQPYPAVRDLVFTICNTPDERLFLVLDSLQQSAPDFEGLVDWIRKRPEWLVEVARAMRRQVVEAENAGQSANAT